MDNVKDQEKSTEQRNKISSPKRMNHSKRGVHTIKEKCEHCGHHKKLVGGGVKRCAKCRRS